MSGGECPEGPFDLFPVDWVAADVPGPDGDDAYTVTLFGKLPDRRSACVHVAFFPYFFVELPRGWSGSRQKLFLAEAAAKYGCVPQYTRLVQRVPMWGYVAAERRPFAQLAFPTLAKFKSARYKLAREYQTYEGAVDPVVRLFHVRDIKPSAWLRVSRARPVAEAVSTCDIEARCSFVDLGPSSLTSQPPLVLASEFHGRAGGGASSVILQPFCGTPFVS